MSVVCHRTTTARVSRSHDGTQPDLGAVNNIGTLVPVNCHRYGNLMEAFVSGGKAENSTIPKVACTDIDLRAHTHVNKPSHAKLVAVCDLLRHFVFTLIVS